MEAQLVVIMVTAWVSALANTRFKRTAFSKYNVNNQQSILSFSQQTYPCFIERVFSEAAV